MTTKSSHQKHIKKSYFFWIWLIEKLFQIYILIGYLNIYTHLKNKLQKIMFSLVSTFLYYSTFYSIIAFEKKLRNISQTLPLPHRNNTIASPLELSG